MKVKVGRRNTNEEGKGGGIEGKGAVMGSLGLVEVAVVAVADLSFFIADI